MNDFYVYRHIRLDSNTPFYIGKGKGFRAGKKTRRNQYWNNIVKSVGYKVEIVISNLTEEQSFRKEQELIKLYKKFGYCEANMSEGGEGPSNPCKETRQKMSNSAKGNKSKAKRCMDTKTGQIYKSLKEAAKQTGFTYSAVRAMMCGKNPNKTNLKYIM